MVRTLLKIFGFGILFTTYWNWFVASLVETTLSYPRGIGLMGLIAALDIYRSAWCEHRFLTLTRSETLLSDLIWGVDQLLKIVVFLGLGFLLQLGLPEGASAVSTSFLL